MVAPWKKKQVDELASKVKGAKTTALVKISGIPSKQFQQIRKKLKGDMEIQVVRNNMLKRGLEKAGLKDLVEHVEGPRGLVTSELNPFKLSKLINSCKINAPAKAGSIAPYDIIVPKGDTPLPAGPAIGEVQGAGIKAKIQGGKIVVTEASLVVKEGEPVPVVAAGILAKLGITPSEIGLELDTAFEEGVIYGSDILSVNEESTKAQLIEAYSSAFNLAFNAGIPTKETIELMVQMAHNKAVNLSYEAEIVNSETVEYFLSKGHSAAAALKGKVPEEAPKEETKKEAPEEKKEEEVKEGSKEEKPVEESKVEDTPHGEEKATAEEKPSE